MDIIIAIFAIYGLAFAIKETDGPWNVIGRWRNWMMKLPVVGVDFYKLLSCYYCTGCWAGLAVYLMTQESYKLGWALCYALAGGAVCVIIDTIHTRLLRE
jgi:hypothetical protein